MSMDKCNNCGAMLGVGDKFCGDCGAKVIYNVEPAEQNVSDAIESYEPVASQSTLLQLLIICLMFTVALFIADSIWWFVYEEYTNYEFLGSDWFVFSLITSLTVIFTFFLFKFWLQNLVTEGLTRVLVFSAFNSVLYLCSFYVLSNGMVAELLNLNLFDLAPYTADLFIFSLITTALFYVSKKVIN